MKILAIVLLGIGTLSGVKTYTSNLKLQVSVLKEWKSVFMFWQEQIEQFSTSLPELFEKTIENDFFKNFYILKDISCNDILQIINSVSSGNYVIESAEKSVILDTLQKMGGSLLDAQIRNLNFGIHSLDKIISDKEIKVRDRCNVVYKLAPLLSAALAVILW